MGKIAFCASGYSISRLEFGTKYCHDSPSMDKEQRAGQEARLRELAEWLKKQRSEFTEYDDTLTRRYMERITVVDAETIRIKFRYTDAEIDRVIRK